MNKMNKKLIASFLAGAVLVGCGGGGSSSTPTDNTSTNTNETNTDTYGKLIGGQVTDGYIARADVFVDINTTGKNNGTLGSGDYNTTTDTNGNFSVSTSLAVEVGTFIYATGGVNIATGEDFNGTLKGVFSGVTESIILSPLTTMVAAKVANGEKIEDAQQKVADALGISKDNVNADPATNKETLVATQKVVAAAKVLQTDSNKDISEIIEDIAKNLDKGDLTKAIEETATDSKIAQAAKETVDAVEEAIDKLDDTVEDNAAIENIVNTYVVTNAVEATENDSNVTEALEEAKSTIEDNTTIDIANAVDCLEFDVIKGDNTDVNAVDKALNLANKSVCEKNDVAIAWIGANPAKVDLATGVVTPDSYNSIDVILDANVSKNDKFTIKPILFTLEAKGHKPVAINDNVTTNEDIAVTIDVLANDTDADGLDELSIEIASNPENGTAVVEDRKIVYTPNENFSGNDSFEYKLIDPLGEEVTATVNVVVIPVNDAPVLVDVPESETIDEDTPAFDITLNAADVDDTDLTFSATSSDTNIVEVAVNGNVLTVTPKPNANGTVDITVTVTDANGATDSKTVALTINPVNDAPVASDDTASVASNSYVLIDVLANDSDIDGDTLTITSITQPSSGEATIDNGKIKYVPASNFNGTVEFNYTISDGIDSATAKVTVDVAQYISKMTQAINEAENYNIENNDLNTLLNNMKAILQEAPDSEKDAQVGLAIVELAQTLDTEVDKLISIDGADSGNLQKLLNSGASSVDLANTIDSLSDQTEESLSEVASKLVAVSQQLDTLFADSNYVFKYKDFKLNANDASALSALLLLEASNLEFTSAYSIVKKDYIDTKTVTVDGRTYEYKVIHADPKTVFNDATTLSLNSNAQTHFNNAKSNLDNALAKLANFDSSKSNMDFKDKITENKAKLNAIKTSLNGGADYEFEDNRGRKIFIKVSALFDTSTALTLSNTLSNNWTYKPHWDDYPFEYNATLSQMKNNAIGTYYSSEQNEMFDTKMEAKPVSLPMGSNNALTKVISKIEDGDKTYTGDDILKLLFGEFDVQDSDFDESTLSTTFTIIDSPAGYTGPYNCSVDEVEAYDSEWNEVSTEDLLTVSMTDSNHCKVTVNDSDFNGIVIYYQILVEDSYGNHEREYGEVFLDGNSDGNDDGDDDGNNDGDDSDSSELTFEFYISEDDFNNATSSQALANGKYYEVEYEPEKDEIELDEYTVSDDTIDYVEYINDAERESATVPYTVNNNIIEIDYNSEHDGADIYLKNISTLDYEDLNEKFNDLIGEEANIFGSGDEGYVLFEKEIDEENEIDNWLFEGKVWLNESAKNKIIDFINNNLRGN